MDTSLTLELVYKNKNQNKHKSKPLQFASVAGGVQKRLEKNLKHRKDTRLTEYDSVRNLSKTETPVKERLAQTKQEHRRQQLEKWKEEKEKKKKELAAAKKKPFLTGVAPLKSALPPPPPPKPVPSTSGRVTRSQSAKTKKIQEQSSFAPKNAQFRPPLLKNTTGPAFNSMTLKADKKTKNSAVTVFNPLPHRTEKKTNINTRSKTNLAQAPAVNAVTNTRSKIGSTSQPQNKASTKKDATKPKVTSVTKEPRAQKDTSFPKVPSAQKDSVPKRNSAQKEAVPKRNSAQKVTPKSESNCEEKLRSPKDAAGAVVQGTPEAETKISPCVTMSRGKENARREMKQKLREGLLADDACDMESVQHFRRQLQSEIERLTRICGEWDALYSTDLPEVVQEQMLGALGQARLLMTQKLQQFAGLVERCAARETSGGLVTPADLQGFWDMVFIQVENVDLRFKKLEEMRAREWREEAPAAVEKRPANKQSRPAARKTAAPSRLREMIAAARKAKQDQGASSSDNSGPSTPAKTTPAGPSADSKTFDAGFFVVRSPVCSPATPRNRASLLKNVLSSEARKASASKQCASFAMLRASVIGKNMEIEGIAPLEQTPKLPPIDLNATPARSILKSTNKSVAKKSGKKSIKTVLFDDSDDENTQPQPKEREQVSFMDVESTESENTDENASPVTADRSPNSQIQNEGTERCTEAEIHTDSGVSSMDVEREAENKENVKKNKLVRQDAVNYSPIQTRSRRKSKNTPKEQEVKTPKRSTRRKTLQDAENNVKEDEKMAVTQDLPKTTPRKSRRSRLIEDLIDLGTPVGVETRRRRNKSDV